MCEVTGGLRQFSAEADTAQPDEVWRLWTSPATWGEWDRGLSSARLVGPFRVGARGQLVDLRRRTSTFVVDEVSESPAAGSGRRRCRYHVSLPGARLVLTRTVESTRVRHEVAFQGPSAPVWALVLGRGFRRQLPPTLDALLAAADRAARR